MSAESSQEARIAVLESRLRALEEAYTDDMQEVKADVKTILGKFNQMTGGQKAWFALAAILGAISGIIASALTALAFAIGHK